MIGSYFWVEITLSLSIKDLQGSNQKKKKDLQGCESNTVYYTDDNWDQMNEDHLYGDHDCGMFNLTDGSSKT